MASTLRMSTFSSSQFRPVHTPVNRPKWNTVSKTRSVNSVYNPELTNANQIRRGWDFELRRKRKHKLPPLKRSEHKKTTPLPIEAPLPSTQRLALDYHPAPSSMRDGTVSMDYATNSSRRSSRALVPFRRLPELQLVMETPRSQRPIQQEWNDEFNKSQIVQAGNQSFRTSIESRQQSNTPRDPLTRRSSTRNSQHSGLTNRFLDSSIRTNRVTELRLSRDLDEHHQHCHTPHQSMPLEIRGFQLEGSSLTVPDHATIRPLSNVNYRASERVRNHRIYPWSNLHPSGPPSSRSSVLLPINELRRPSFEDKIIEMPSLILEE